jgi:hypothetical protein
LGNVIKCSDTFAINLWEEAKRAKHPEGRHLEAYGLTCYSRSP